MLWKDSVQSERHFGRYHVVGMLEVRLEEDGDERDLSGEEEAGNKNVYFLKKFIYFYLFLAALGLCCCTRAFSSCGEWGLLFDMVCRLLIVVASLAAEHGL